MQVPFRGPAALALGLALAAGPAASAAPPAGTDAYLDATAARWTEVSRKIWEYAETALQETKSAALLEEVLEKEGFAVTRGVAGMPTAFVATAGSGAPVVAILAEYDALPGLSQKAGEAKKSPAVAGAPGQGCGHNLLGTAAVAAAVAANRERIEKKLPGHDPGLRNARRGADPRQDVHAAGRGVRGNGRRPRVAPRGRELRLLRRAPRDHGARRRVLREDGARRREPVARPQLPRRPGGLRARDVAHARARPPDGATSPRREGRWPRREHHPGLRARAVVRPRRERRAHERDGRPAEKGRGRRRPRDRDDGEGDAPRHDARADLQRGAFEARPEADRARRRAEMGRGGPGAREGDPEGGRDPGEGPLGERFSRWAKGRGASASSDTGEVSAAYPLIELGVQTAPTGAPWHHWDVASCAAAPMGVKGMLVAAKVLGASTVDLLKDPAAVAAAKAEFAKATAGKPYVTPLAPDAKPKTY